MPESRADYDVVAKQLFDWEGWEPLSDDLVQFTDVTTKVPFGDIPVGEKFEWAIVSFEHGFVQLPWNGQYHEFELNFVIGKHLGAGPLAS